MTEEWNPAVEGGNLLYPELLSREELVQVLLSRCVQKQLIEGLDKYKLVDLFHRIVLPLPQRTYSDNRRGKILNALRKKAEKSSKNEEKEASATSRSVQRSSVSRDDLKSPHEKRTLSRVSLDHIVINDRRKRPKSEDESLQKSVESPKLPSAESKSSTVIKLKRSHKLEEPLPAKTEENEEDEKKKKRKIVWP